MAKRSKPDPDTIGVTEQHWDPVRYQREAGFVADLGLPVLELLAPKSGERILDLGCGDGKLTKRLADMGCDVLAQDFSADQVAAAKQRGLKAEVQDGQTLPGRKDLHGQFDAVFSNATLHWLKRDPAAAIDGVWHCLRPGGRFVAEFGGHGNVAAVRTALHSALRHRGIDPLACDPWYFPSAEAYRKLLEARGFRVEEIAIIPRPTPLPGDFGGWLDTFADSFLASLEPEQRPKVRSEVVELAQPMLQADDGTWILDYVRLRFKAVRDG